MHFLRLTEWHGVAACYAKRAGSFLSIVQIRCIIYWLGYVWIIFNFREGFNVYG